jgi:hypothetical protein
MMDSRIFDDIGGGGGRQPHVDPQRGGFGDVLRRLIAQKLAGGQANPGQPAPGEFAPNLGDYAGRFDPRMMPQQDPVGQPRILSPGKSPQDYIDRGGFVGPRDGMFGGATAIPMPEPVSPGQLEPSVPAGPVAQARPRPMRTAMRRFGGPSGMEY